MGALPSETFGRRLKLFRQRRGWSARQLSEAVGAQGVPISRGTIAKIETNTRGTVGVTLDEAVALSVALEIPLALFVLPVETDHEVTLTPATTINTWYALEWMGGNQSLGGQWPPGVLDALAPVWQYEKVRAAQKVVNAGLTDLRYARSLHDRGLVADARRAVHSARQALREALEGLAALAPQTVEGLAGTYFDEEV